MTQPEPTAKRECMDDPDVGGVMDRLSALPDGLLHLIMSFLPAPQVVRTCLLSSRWRYLWRTMPRLNIDEKDFGISETTSSNALDEKWGKFEDFATNLLLFHDSTSSLDEFRLSCHLFHWLHLDRWIRRGIEYCPALLQIQIQMNWYNYNPSFKMSPVMSSNFRHLKTLYLCGLELDRRFMDLLCSSCPVMEDLKLEKCMFSDNHFQRIESSTLKKLVMHCCVNNTSHPLFIMAPSLTYLDLWDECQDGIWLQNMDSLVKASIQVAGENETLSLERLGLLGSLFNVTSLELAGFESEVMLSLKSDEFPIFHNLRTIYFNSCFLDHYDLNDKLEALGNFLQNTPCLEKLTLKYCMYYSFPDSEWEIERKNITLQRLGRRLTPEGVASLGVEGTFQCPKLKLIEVIYDYDHDHRLIEILWSLGRSFPEASIKLTKDE
ncbi:hypothetical protein EJB05_52496 [Eragrostis curvula]|uniref:F-box domain-containing protein n=1 Tax=Eragrostis curvula TaxID=38414 RepID=A0A5J9SSL8_9POAL|nr:hypothetical protein EJB05_52496 [Eragrostis curvula]